MPAHFVAIFGGAVSGAEAASQLASRGIKAVVFDQNALPYGKIEDGLPKWHVKLRDKEEARINEKLSTENVYFVPNTRLGRDMDFSEVVQDWGFSAVLLATGAWRDRPLPLAGIEEYVGKGLVYQNPFIYWFNHYHEPDYKGPQFEIHDNTLIVGGGLASLDVAKVLMIETVQRALHVRGIETNMFELDHSIAQVLERHDLSLKDLGLKGCTLFYRRRVIDMPLSPFEPDTEEKLEKAHIVRKKILDNFVEKYLFKVKPLHIPIDKVVRKERLAGLKFRCTHLENGELLEIHGTEKTVLSPMVISSIGSIPEAIEGIPVSGQIFHLAEDDECCRLEGFDHVFALGNAVTGRGNIMESLKHGKEVSQALVETYLAESDPTTKEDMYQEAFRKTESAVEVRVSKIADRLSSIPHLSDEEIDKLTARIQSLQKRVGYDGEYATWIKRHLPIRLEEMTGHR